MNTMLAENPDVLCWCTSYTTMVHATSAQAFPKGFKGRIAWCTLDDYPALIAKMSPDFIEGSIFQFPDFDHPLLADTTFSFTTRINFTKILQVNFPTAGLRSGGNMRLCWIFDFLMLNRSIQGRVSRFLPLWSKWKMLNMSFSLAQWWCEKLFGITKALAVD